MKIAVTGGMGFIGHELVKKLLDESHEVILVDFWKDLIPRYEKTRMPILEAIYSILPRCSAVLEPWEFIQDMAKLGPSVVVHAGAVVNTKDLGSEELFQRNITYTESIAQTCDAIGANLIFVSSAAVYGMHGYPNNPYGLTKALGERIVNKIRPRLASVRLFNVFGKYEHHKGEMASVPWKIANSLSKGGRFDLHSGTACRDFVPSSEVVRAISKLAFDMLAPGPKWHKTYDIGTGSATAFMDLANQIVQITGRDEQAIKMVDIPPELVGRYQTYTCAGKNGVENLGGMMSTAKGLAEAYGVDK